MMLFPLLALAVRCIASCDGEWSITLPRSSTTIEASFDVSISGATASHVIDINSNEGTVTQHERITSVAVNFKIPWDGLVLYAFIGADTAGLMMGWAYCSGTRLTDLWLEDTRGQAGFITPRVTGNCSVSPTAKNVELTFSEQCYDIEPPSNLPMINGMDLKLNSGAPGTVMLAGLPYKILPFTIVDCKTCSSANLDGGWVEIHVVMKSSSNLCLGIFYLQIKLKDTIALDYVNCFFKDVQNTEFRAQYQITETSFSTTTTTTTAVSNMTTIFSPTISTLGDTTISSLIGPITSPITSTTSSNITPSTSTSSSQTESPTNASGKDDVPILGCSISSIFLIYLLLINFL